MGKSERINQQLISSHRQVNWPCPENNLIPEATHVHRFPLKTRRIVPAQFILIRLWLLWLQARRAWKAKVFLLHRIFFLAERETFSSIFFCCAFKFEGKKSSLKKHKLETKLIIQVLKFSSPFLNQTFA